MRDTGAGAIDSTPTAAGPWQRPLRRASWLLLPLLLACGSSADESGASSAGSGGDPGAGGTGHGGETPTSMASTGAGASGSTSSGGAAEPKGAEHIPAHQSLKACGSGPKPCDEASVLYAGGYPGGINDLACVLQGLRDRTPGLYRVTLTSSYSDYDEDSMQWLYVTPSGAVERARYLRTVEYWEGRSETTSQSYLPTERCVLKTPAYFEDCLSHFGPGPNDYSEDAWDCLPWQFEHSLPWFSCTPQLPTCQ